MLQHYICSFPEVLHFNLGHQLNREIVSCKMLSYPDTRVLIFLPSRIPRTRVGFQGLFAVSPKILTNRTPAPESDTDTRTRVHVTLVKCRVYSKCRRDTGTLRWSIYLQIFSIWGPTYRIKRVEGDIGIMGYKPNMVVSFMDRSNLLLQIGHGKSTCKSFNKGTRFQ